MGTKTRIIRFTLTVLGLCCQLALLAQKGEREVKGQVTDSQMPGGVPGVTVQVKDGTTGTLTDAEGRFSISVPENATLVFSSIGYATQEIVVGNSSEIKVLLEVSNSQLEEVVVIGYGAQKSKDLTGSISTIKSEEIEKTPAANAMQSLQGKIPGLQIVSAGSPGESPTVRLRGLGTYSGSGDPLYVVDGMFYSNIDFLNTKDIKQVTVLKDASSSAIYGVRAANGVIIIETKSGNLERAPQIEYDGYVGVQVAQNVVKMANAEQFSTMAYESGSSADAQFVLNAMQRFGRSRINPNVPDVNTDWYNEIMRPATMTSHSIGITGGGSKVSYALGGNYLLQDGILDMKNQYDRFNIRSKVDVNLTKQIKMGVNAVISNANKYSPENAAWFKAYFAVPIMPVMDESNLDALPTHYSNAQLLGYRGTQNPFPDLNYKENLLKIRKVLSNIYLQAELIPDKLTFRTAYNHDFSALDERYVSLPYTLGNNVRVNSSIKKANNTYSNQIWDNTLTYQDIFGDHNLTVLLGTSYRDEAEHKFSATGTNVKGIEYETSWYLDYADGTTFNNNVEDNGKRVYGLSYFGRVAYNYAGKYLLYGTMRADGSSKFTKDPWGYFPSVGAGWVLSEENFLNGSDAVDFLKLRVSWGRLGNDNVPASSGSNTIEVVTTDIGNIPSTGYTSTSTYTDNEWELIEEKNFGANLVTLNNRLSVDADYYIRETKNAIMPVFIPITNVYINKNSGTIRNQGLELALNWNETLSNDFSYNIGVNLTTLKNEVVSLIDPYIDAGSAEFRQRTIVGGSIKAFYGYETVGVYQNQAEIDDDPVAIANGLEPGDLIYKDQNTDGLIDGDDRVVLGSYLPSFMYGSHIGASYKNWDLSLSVYGQTGNKILNRKRGEIIFTQDTNIDADLAVNRWHGEGTSDSYPSSKGLRKGWNQKLSNFWVEDGSYFRIQNIRLGYAIPGGKFLGMDMPDTKIAFTAERPLTLFQYNGFNPEVPDGVDRQTYPVPAVYTIGINFKL